MLVPDDPDELMRERIIEQPARMPRDQPSFRIITRVRKCFQKGSQQLLVHVKSISRRALRIVLGRLDTAKTDVIGARVNLAFAAGSDNVARAVLVVAKE